MSRVADDLRALAERCAELSKETTDQEIIDALERLGRALEDSIRKLEQSLAATNWRRLNGH